MGRAIPGEGTHPSREADTWCCGSGCIHRSVHHSKSAAMNPIEIFLRIVTIIGILVAIVFVEMVGVAIADAINQEMKTKEETKDKEDDE